MKHLRLVLAALIAFAVTGLVAPAASAAEPVTGTVAIQESFGYYDEATDQWIPGTTAPVSGAVVSAYLPARNGGPVSKPFTSVVTGSDGAFALDIGLGPVCIKVEAPAQWQSGWVYYPVSDPEYPQIGVYPTAPATCSISAGDWLGSVVLIHADAWGWVVDQNGAPIRGALVRYSPYDFSGRTFSAMTDASGYYLIQGLDYEEFEVQVSARKFQSGWVSASGVVVPTFGEAANHGTGAIGTADHLITMTLR